MKDLLRTSDLSIDDMNLVLDLAAELKNNPMKHHGLLAGQTVVLYFAKPSTRTRFSFETAVARLGGIPSSVNSADLQIGRGETLEDTAMVVSRYASAFVIRTYADDDVKLVAEKASIPVINALTDLHHPMQSLADIMTLKEKWGTLKGKKLAYVGAFNNVLNSLLEVSAMAGLSITAATPDGYGPDPLIAANAKEIAKLTGATVELTADPYQAVWEADAVYTDTWFSMGDSEETRAKAYADLTPYRVTQGLMTDLPNRDAVFMHCLPVHRGEEVTAEVIDGPQSIVFDQAENRLHTSHAVLYALIKGQLKGSAAQPSLSPAAIATEHKVAAD